MAEHTLAVSLDRAGSALLDRHADWWQRKGTLFAAIKGEPLGDLWLPLADGTLAKEDLDISPNLIDVDRLSQKARSPGPIGVVGDFFETQVPYVRVPWVEAILGTPIRATIQGGSMRTLAFINDWQDWENRAVKRDEAWLSLLLQLTRLLVERSGGRYAVAHTLMRGPSDLAEAVLGPERMVFAMYDQPQALRRFLDEATDTFVYVLQAQAALVPPIEDGHVNFFGIWAPGTVVRTQCDASAFLSPAHYAEWYLPYDGRICEQVDYSVIHLHSCSLHTVDALLEEEHPTAIQVTLEQPPSGPPLETLLPTFRQILAVKPLLLEGPLSGAAVQLLRDGLPPDGLAIIAREEDW